MFKFILTDNQYFMNLAS